MSSECNNVKLAIRNDKSEVVCAMKGKKASHPPKPVPNLKQLLHLLHMDLCGPMRVKSINGNRYVLVIVEEYSRYMWVYFIKSKDEAPEVIKTFLKKTQVLLQAPVIISIEPRDKENLGDNEYGDMCIYAQSVSTMKPSNVKEAMTDLAWIDSMQEELLQFKRLDVWMLLKEDVYVCQAEGFIDVDHPIHIYNLRKALYGLQQAPKAWYDKLLKFLLQNHFFKGTIDPTLFIRCFDDEVLVVQVYVDDNIFGSTNPRYTQLFADLMKSRIENSMIRELMFFLGLQVNQSLDGISVKPGLNYVVRQSFKIIMGMETCDPIGTPMEIKDKLDLDQNETLAKPTEKHLKEVKRIFRYLWGTVNMGLRYTKDSGFELTGLSDADYAGCKDTFKSTSGGAQFLGEKLVSWSSKKQDCTVLSTAEAEYMSLSACCAQVLWMRTQLTDYGFHFNKIPIYYDLKLAIAISCNPVQHSRTKHIVVRYHFIKEHVEKGTIELYFVKTYYQLADLFTKAILAERFNYLVCRLGMRSLSPQELERLAKSQ
ncbi:retrovirus-related pol polyprotein from transposon TNT 1-94 [Tanacetum coccineum]